MKIDLDQAEVERIADALEILADNYGKANMPRAREKCLEVRSKLVKSELEQRSSEPEGR